MRYALLLSFSLFIAKPSFASERGSFVASSPDPSFLRLPEAPVLSVFGGPYVSAIIPHMNSPEIALPPSNGFQRSRTASQTPSQISETSSSSSSSQQNAQEIWESTSFVIEETEQTQVERVYITTNEAHAGSRRHIQRTDPEAGANTIVGVSVMEILNLAAQRENIEYIVALDITPQTVRFWRALVIMIEESLNPAEFTRRLIQFIDENQDWIVGSRAQYDYEAIPALRSLSISEIQRAYREQILESLSNEVMGGESWLSLSERYERIRNIVLKKNLFVKQMNLADLQSTTWLAQFLRDHGMRIDIFYISNVACVTNNSKELADFSQTLSHIARQNGAMLFLYSLPTQKNKTCSQHLLKLKDSATKKDHIDLAKIILLKIYSE